EHIKAVNRFIDSLRVKLDEMMRWVGAAASAAKREPGSERLRVLLERKEVASNRVLYVEGIWDFYFDLFVQRLSSFSDRLLSVDRTCANCYDDLYVGIGAAQPTPSLLPFSYADSGFSQATYRRVVRLPRLSYNKNLFRLIMFPLLLGGPAAVESLMDVVGRAPASTVKFNPMGVPPTPYLRVLISLILLHRMGFEKMAADLRRVWLRLYPRLTPADIPPPIME